MQAAHVVLEGSPMQAVPHPATTALQAAHSAVLQCAASHPTLHPSSQLQQNILQGPFPQQPKLGLRSQHALENPRIIIKMEIDNNEQ